MMNIPTALNVTFLIIRLASSFFCSFPSHHSDIIAAAMQMLSSHRCLLVIVAVELSIILVACLALHLSCHAKSMLGLGSTAKDRKRADVVLGISAAFPIILSVVALGLSTRPDLQTWMAPVERSVCLFLVFSQASAFSLSPLYVYQANTSQCVYIWLLLPSAKPWQLWVVCVCGILSPLLSLLPPTLESLDYTYHSAWYIHLPAPLLGLIICVIQVLLLGRQIRLSYKIKSRTHDPQLSLIIHIFVAVAEAGIFLMLVVFFFNRKREYENQSVVFCSHLLMVYVTN